jgi:hypothetical protein
MPTGQAQIGNNIESVQGQQWPFFLILPKIVKSVCHYRRFFFTTGIIDYNALNKNTAASSGVFAL